ncbi:uncharacterized protein [Polyergus mexicanus]|uniref:uncharacterized protein n=1 Tax=Polyergus mexicanus TaxID=615972 RepID=UPI0038B4B1C4
MTDSLQGLLIEQSITISSMKRVFPNFKKMGKANVTQYKAKSRLDALETLWERCQRLNVQLQQIATADEQRTVPYFTEEEFFTAEDVYHEAADYLADVIGKFSRCDPNAASTVSDISSRELSGAVSLQLPRIPLPKFSGNFAEWENFRGIFESLVASKESLSNTQKLHYLKASVTGEAAVLINHVKIADANYDGAWKLLIEDPRTRNEWNLQRGKSTASPTYEEIRDFMTLRIRGLTDHSKLNADTSSHKNKGSNRASVNNVATEKCLNCSGNHNLMLCDEFKPKSVEQRTQFLKSHKCCFNCLKVGHFPTSCKSKKRCNLCRRAHHTLLHRASNIPVQKIGENSVLENKTLNAQPSGSATPEIKNETAVASVQTIHSPLKNPPNVLLATAWVILRTIEGRKFKVRALLDQGSAVSFISESLCQTMRTKRSRASLHVQCFGERYSGVAKSQVSLTLESCNGRGSSTFSLTAFVYQKITSYAGSKTKTVDYWPHLRKLSLADPDPFSNHPIHLLIGSDLYGSLLKQKIKHGPTGTPTAQLTALGWILSGPTGTSNSITGSATSLNCVTIPSLDSLLQKFWEIEEISSEIQQSEEDKKCEQHFIETHQRAEDGRYIIRLPFKTNPPLDIGASRETAALLYSKLEQRLRKNPDLAKPYHSFLNEYKSMGHMELVSDENPTLNQAVYIPHHPVLRESSSTTKLRVVFNASCKTSNGSTLNNHLMTGPKLQRDLSSIILRWRQFRYVYTADIEKMFRQIRVHRDDVDFLRIFWRSNINSPIQSYRLLTVTYGTAPAPYLAMRVINQLAIDEGHSFPKAQTIVQDFIYVDDVLFGADEVPSLKESRDQLTKLMARGGFHLRKWAANSIELLTDIPPGEYELAIARTFDKDDTLKVLGLEWIPREDSFRFQIESPSVNMNTKRLILSFIAKFFDPLGWVSPVIITAKIMIQELWLRKLDWDSPIAEDLLEPWKKYCAEFINLKEIRIPRWTGMHPENLAIELHGFADASNRAYAAVVYLRILRSLSEFSVVLITAKSKVAPIKTISVPRLELNAIVLLTRLLEFAQKSLNMQHIPTYGWTDSSVALAWLRGHPSRWTTYVANRVSEVQTRLPSIKWNHVPSKENPADCASRGLSPAELRDFELWWAGPAWLRSPSTAWPIHDKLKDQLEADRQMIETETRNTIVCHAQHILEWQLPNEVSTWKKLIRVTARVQRFINNLKCRATNTNVNTTCLSAAELKEASLFWLHYVQQRHFPSEIQALNDKSLLPRSSSLLSLYPFLGKDKLIRLGGRIDHSSLSYDERHPIILPKHRISDLLIAQAHKASLHGGTQLMLRILRQNYWIISARTSVKSLIRSCVKCVRERARTSQQLMGNLPQPRVTPSAPFSHTGVDYAGPMNIFPSVGRGQRSKKYYVAVFICLSTKAVHLEYVDDYATNGFLSAFRRFASRRGLPSDMYSDNGTNFQGADRELNTTFQRLVADPPIQDAIANDNIKWHFIPPSAPHFGGLWEAGVKGLKFHLKRAIGSRTLSQIEFATLLCQIEACLNSRPISALHDDPNDFSALTPGHFLVGRPLVSPPEESVLDIDSNRLSRWQQVRAILEQIWRSWSSDYLHTLQQRRKWRENEPELKINELVLLKNNLAPPSKWELARILDVHPGSDGHVRVVTLRTAKTTLKRPITQICQLPISSDTGS